jgi:ATP-dependent helicase/nuclease subunit A
MKERIGKKLEEYFFELSDRDAGKLAKDFSRANISTIHAFFSKLITRYFSELGIDPYFSIIDEAYAEKLKERAFSDTLRHYNSKDDAAYYDLAFSLSGSKSDAGLFEALEKYRELLTAKPMAEEYDFYESLDNCLSYIVGDMRRKINEYLKIAAAISGGCPPEHKCAEVADVITERLRELSKAEGQDDFLRRLAECEDVKGRISRKDGDETTEKIWLLKKYFNETVREFKRQAGEIPELIEHAALDKELIFKFVEVSDFYSKAYTALKRDENKLDYSDLERLTVKLAENSDIVDELKARYKYILVDEYQDTSEIQEYILSRLENGNFFAVGDVKQSIFNFRLADPTIFLARKKRYAEGSCGNAGSLNNNYRTSDRVIDFINRVFSVVMTEENGGVDYKNRERLVGAVEYKNDGEAYSTAFFERTKTDTVINGLYSVADDEGLEPDDASYREGLYIAGKIKELTASDIYVPGDGGYRPTGYGDIAVIVRSRGDGAEKILAALRDENIPFAADGFFEDDPYCAALAELLKAVNNSGDDIALAATAVSYFGGFSNEDLKEIRLNDPDGKILFDSIEKYTADKINLEDGTEKRRALRLREFTDYISRLKECAADNDIYGLLREIVYGGGYDACAGKKAVLLEKFVESFKNADFSLSRYIYDLNEIRVKADTAGDSADKVNVMTVHASKGLEFPIVFLADAAHIFNRRHEQLPYAFNNKLKIGFYHRDIKRMTQKNSIFKKAINLKKNDEQVQEEARLLYVAMTRAKNRLFITAGGRPVKDDDACIFKRRASFFDFIRFAAFFDEGLKDSFLYNPRAEASDNNQALPDGGADMSAGDAEKISEYLKARLKKISAPKYSALKKSATAIGRESYKGAFFGEDSGRVFDKGNAYHRVMQHISFDLTELSDISAFVETLIRDGLLSAEEARLVDLADIKKCMECKLIKYARENKYFREREFIMYAPKNDFYGDGDDERILVQGIIDLLIVGKNGGIIVDYKTGRINEETKLAYKRQLGIYRRAAEEAGIKIDAAYVYSFASGDYIEV